MLNTIKLLDYRNDNVIARYQQDFPQAKMSANDAFRELMKYIWLCKKHKAERHQRPDDVSLHFYCSMHDEMKEIDNMWHTFLLFTLDYHAFCNDYLDGVFFHHVPLSEALPRDEYELDLTRYLSYIYDNLGEETVLTWFDHDGSDAR